MQGVVPEHFARASGGLIRHILQQLEEIGFVEKNPGSHGGRRITSQVGARDGDTSCFDDAHCFKLGGFEAVGLMLSGQRVWPSHVQSCLDCAYALHVVQLSYIFSDIHTHCATGTA